MISIATQDGRAELANGEFVELSPEMAEAIRRDLAGVSVKRKTAGSGETWDSL